MNYQAHYDKLIARAQARSLPSNTYTESHHIVPRCLGGSNKKTNLVNLLPEEHVFAHRLLCRIHPTHMGLSYAVIRLCSSKHGRLQRKMYAADKLRASVLRKALFTQCKKANIIIDNDAALLNKFFDKDYEPSLHDSRVVSRLKKVVDWCNTHDTDKPLIDNKGVLREVFGNYYSHRLSSWCFHQVLTRDLRYSYNQQLGNGTHNPYIYIFNKQGIEMLTAMIANAPKLSVTTLQMTRMINKALTKVLK